MNAANMYEGGCLCGAVRYNVAGPLRPVRACHCVQCRKTSGHYVSATSAAQGDLRLVGGTDALIWYRSSEKAERGFCGRCGSNLFWRPTDGAHVSIYAGTLDGKTGLKTVVHIYCAFKGDYYELPDDGTPKREAQ